MTKRDVKVWEEKFEEMLETAKARFEPLIVLWGPAKGDEAGFWKREKVAGAIRQESQRAAVIYPEDRKMIVATAQFVDDDLDKQEVLQAAAADLVFALDISPGVAQEIARYSLNTKIARHLIIIAPESKRHGYSAIVNRTLKVKFLRDPDLKTCDVASEFCRIKVRSWFLKKLLEEDLALAS